MTHRRQGFSASGKKPLHQPCYFAGRKKPPGQLPTGPRSPGLVTLRPSPCQLPGSHRNLFTVRFGPNLGHHRTAAPWLPFLSVGDVCFLLQPSQRSFWDSPLLAGAQQCPEDRAELHPSTSFWSHRHLLALLKTLTLIFAKISPSPLFKSSLNLRISSESLPH